MDDPFNMNFYNSSVETNKKKQNSQYEAMPSLEQIKREQQQQQQNPSLSYDELKRQLDACKYKTKMTPPPRPRPKTSPYNKPTGFNSSSSSNYMDNVSSNINFHNSSPENNKKQTKNLVQKDITSGTVGVVIQEESTKKIIENLSKTINSVRKEKEMQQQQCEREKANIKNNYEKMLKKQEHEHLSGYDKLPSDYNVNVHSTYDEFPKTQDPKKQTHYASMPPTELMGNYARLPPKQPVTKQNPYGKIPIDVIKQNQFVASKCINNDDDSDSDDSEFGYSDTSSESEYGSESDSDDEEEDNMILYIDNKLDKVTIAINNWYENEKLKKLQQQQPLVQPPTSQTNLNMLSNAINGWYNNEKQNILLLYQ